MSQPDTPPAPQYFEREISPDFSVLAAGRLIAYLWRLEPGEVGGAWRGGDDCYLCSAPGCDAVVLSREHEQSVRGACAKAVDLDGLRVSLGIAGYDVEAGWRQPSAQLRRF